MPLDRKLMSEESHKSLFLPLNNQGVLSIDARMRLQCLLHLLVA